jgi:hypothetical protein
MREHTLGSGFFEITNHVNVIDWRHATPGTAVLLLEHRRPPRVSVPLRTSDIAAGDRGELIARVTDNSTAPHWKPVLDNGGEARIAAGFLRPERRRFHEDTGPADAVLIWDDQHPDGFVLEGFQSYLDCHIDLVWRYTT